MGHRTPGWSADLGNEILRVLPSGEAKAILAGSKRLAVARDAILFSAGQPLDTIYFPETALVAVLGETGEGARMEVWSVGREGIAGLSGLVSDVSPYTGMVQVGGEVLAANAQVVRKHLKRWEKFHDEILRYYHRLLVHAAQLGICNGTHAIEQRLCRWLLIMQDRLGSRTLNFTHDSIAAILGTRRATISVAAAALQNAGAISYTPGSITIKSRRCLLDVSCGCYLRLKENRRGSL